MTFDLKKGKVVKGKEKSFAAGKARIFGGRTFRKKEFDKERGGFFQVSRSRGALKRGVVEKGRLKKEGFKNKF